MPFAGSRPALQAHNAAPVRANEESLHEQHFDVPSQRAEIHAGIEQPAVILTKGHDHAKARKIDPSVLLQARLFPDMLPLIRQVQIATDNAKGAVARLGGVEVPRYEDTEQGFEDLQARIARTIAFIATVPAAQVDGSEDKDIVLKLGPREVHFKGLQYLCGFALPNFYFHVTTAYAILRHNGVELNKSDYIGTP